MFSECVYVFLGIQICFRNAHMFLECDMFFFQNTDMFSECAYVFLGLQISYEQNL